MITDASDSSSPGVDDDGSPIDDCDDEERLELFVVVDDSNSTTAARVVTMLVVSSFFFAAGSARSSATAFSPSCTIMVMLRIRSMRWSAVFEWFKLPLVTRTAALNVDNLP